VKIKNWFVNIKFYFYAIADPVLILDIFHISETPVM